MMIEHLIGRKQRDAGAIGDAPEPRQTPPVVAAIEQACRKPYAIGAARAQSLQNIVRLRLIEAVRQRQHQKLVLREFQEIADLQMAFAFEGPLAALAAGEQLA